MNNVYISEIMKTRYGICCDKIRRDRIGSGENYWINEKFLLKVFDYNVKFRIEDEILVCKYLRNRSLCTSVHISAIDRSYIQKIGNCRMHLQYKLPGVTRERNSLDFKQGDSFLKILKHIVTLLREYPFETEINMLFRQEYVMTDVISSVVKRLYIADFALKEIIRRKIELLNKIQFDKGKVYRTVLSHSDYNIQQLLLSDGFICSKNVAVIDFSHVSRIPIEWEIIKSCLRSIEFQTCTCVQSIHNGFKVLGKDIPINYENVCISIIQLISSTYMEKMYLRTNQKKWLVNLNYELDVLENLYYSMR